MLGQFYYDQFFPGIQGGDARVRRMFQTYALSAWVNSDQQIGQEGVWVEGMSPSDAKGYMEDWDGNCLNDVGALPLYNIVTPTLQAKADSITQQDLYPDSPGCWSNPMQWRSLQVSTYGYNVLPFVSDPSIRNEGLAYDLRVDISIDDEYWCPASAAMVQTELTGNDVLHFFVLGYPTATEDLHRAGAEAELVYEYEYSDFDTDPTPTLSFSIGRLGAKYKSVVILMSATEEALEVGPRSARVIPFDYSYWAEGNTSPVTAYTTWPHGDLITDGIVSVNGEVTIQAGAKLVVLPGTTVYFADEAAVGGSGVVGLKLQGGLEIGALGGATTRLLAAEGTWTGIGLADPPYPSTLLRVNSAELVGFKEVSATSNVEVEIADSNFELAAGGTGYAFAGAETAQIQDCQFTGEGVFTLGGSSQVGSHTLTSCQFLPPAGSWFCASLIIEDDAEVSDVLLKGNGPIRCKGGDITLSGIEAMAPDVQTLLPKKGILASDDANVVVEDAILSDFDYAISVENDAMLALRQSALINMQIGVVLNTTQVVDLGHDGETPDSPNWGNNCFMMAQGFNCRTSLLRRNGTCLAERNFWDGEADPVPSYFCGGGVDYEPFLTECSIELPGGGQFDLGMAVGDSPEQTPLPTSLTVYPNPGNPSFTIEAALPQSDRLFSVAVYDVSGRRVRGLGSGLSGGREVHLIWDGTSTEGDPSGSGVYFVQIQQDGRRLAAQKLVLIR